MAIYRLREDVETGRRGEKSAVHFAAMAKVEDDHRFCRVVDVVDDAVVSETDPPTPGVGELETAMRSRLNGKGFGHPDGPRDDVMQKAYEVSFQPTA